MSSDAENRTESRFPVSSMILERYKEIETYKFGPVVDAICHAEPWTGGSGRGRRKRGGVGMLVDEDRTSLGSSLKELMWWRGQYQVQRDGEETRKETRCGEDHTL
ncbi:hypothetical protein QVD17_35681 [Tagetes erecta]|uniref:Uncharacterized protein n=1 Tax=Tagetes erecta TaxID=13708 RepID=A0AAD8NIC7_TARER|nr:hypothetical protein QVD17_35681 [Tagetes erecta]